MASPGKTTHVPSEVIFERTSQVPLIITSFDTDVLHGSDIYHPYHPYAPGSLAPPLAPLEAPRADNAWERYSVGRPAEL